MSKKTKQPFTVLDLPQGSDEWKAERMKWVTASDMAGIMGISGAFKNRNTILREKVKGVAAEVSDFVQERIFDPGHAAEAPLRQAAADELQLELHDIVVVNEKLGILASIDNINLDAGVIVETKLSKADKVLVPAREGKAWEPYRIQVLTQMIATGFKTGYLFVMESDEAENPGKCWLVPVPYCEETVEKILAATEAFQADVAAGRTNEIEILDVRMERLSRLLRHEQHILEEIRGPLDLMKEIKEEIDVIKKVIAEEFTHQSIYGYGVLISKSKPAERLDKDAMIRAGIDLRPFTKFSKPAVTAKLKE